MKFRIQVLNSDFVKNILTLLSGVAVAQILPIALSPILTRLYTPEDFGLFGLYLSLTSAVAVFATGRFDLAIIEPKHDYDAKILVLISFLLSIVFSAFLLIVFIAFNGAIAGLLGDNRISNWLYLVPFSVFSISSVSILYYWLNRKKLYKERSLSRVISSSTISIVSLSIAFFKSIKPGGLILGIFLGQIANVFFLKNFFSFQDVHFNKKKAKIIALKYKDYPKYLMLSTFLEKIAVSLPIFLFTSYYGLVITGFYALSEKIIGGTISVFGQVIGEVYRQKASEEYQELGNCKKTFLYTFKRLFIIGVFLFLFLFFFSELFFSLLFGERWLIAGTITKYLSFSVFFNFLSSPLSYTIVFNKSQNMDTFLQFFRTTFSFFAIYIGFRYSDLMLSVKLYSLVYSIYYIGHSLLQYRSAAGYSRLIFLNKTKICQK